MVGVQVSALAGPGAPATPPHIVGWCARRLQPDGRGRPVAAGNYLVARRDAGRRPGETRTLFLVGPIDYGWRAVHASRSPVIVLCGAQHAEPTVPRALRELRVKGPVAIVTAGWQEREGEPGTVADPGVPAVELALHRRGEQVFADDGE